MKYSKKDLGEELTRELDKGYNIERISRWADNLYYTIRDNDSAEIESILMDIDTMGAGPEFEYTEEELRLLVKKLMNNEKEPFREIQEMKLNRSYFLNLIYAKILGY